MYRRLLFLIVIVFFIIGCASSSGSVDLQDGQIDNVNTPAYPNSYPGKIESGYPGNEITNDLFADLPDHILPIPSPTSNESGVVTGFLYIRDEETKPARGAILYLGEVILENGLPTVSSLNKQIAPHTQVSQVGQFIFNNVPPGQYTLIYDIVTASFVLNSPAGGDLIINVEGGDIVDLGNLQYEKLPILNP